MIAGHLGKSGRNRAGEEFVESGEQGDGPEVTVVISGSFLVDWDGASRFPA